MWCCKCCFLVKVDEHFVQLKDFNFRWTSLMCCFKLLFLEKVALHWSHSRGFNLRCTECMWYCKLCFLAKTDEHFVQLKGFNFRWTSLMCCFRSLFLEKAALHWSHSKGFKGQLISKCPFGNIVWTKIPTKLFLDFCPEIFWTFLGASWRLPCLWYWILSPQEAQKASRKPPGSYKKIQGRNPEIISLVFLSKQ